MTPEEFLKKKGYYAGSLMLSKTTGQGLVSIAQAMQEYADQQLFLHGVTHSSLINDDGSCHSITDGYTTWSKKCTQCKKLSMQVVRVGKVQCRYCG